MDADRGWCGGAGGCGHQLAGGLRVGGATQGLRGDAGAACVPDRAALDILSRPASTAGPGRSEERRVGKEWVSTCRSRGSADNSIKKTNTDAQYREIQTVRN